MELRKETREFRVESEEEAIELIEEWKTKCRGSCRLQNCI